MPSRTEPGVERSGQAELAGSSRCALRSDVLRLGGLLGWSPGDVIAFAEGVTGRPWRRCGAADFHQVLAEYHALAAVIARKRARHERSVPHASGH